MKKIIYDNFTIDNATSRTFDNKGFMHVSAHVSRTGTQEYKAYELGLDGDQNRVIRVHRSPEEVFNQKSLDTFKFIDITPEHKMVNSKNYKELSEGIVINDAIQDNDKVKCDFIIKDEHAIKSIQDGVSGLSVGYTAEYHPSHDPSYDYEQKNITANHIMRTNSPRGGQELKIFDNNGEKKMSHKIELARDVKIEVTDEASVALFNNFKSHNETELKKIFDEKECLIKEIEKLKATSDCLKEENDKLKIEVSDESIKAKITEVNTVITHAKSIAGEDFVCDSMDALEIKTQALGLQDKSDDYINAAFDIKLENVKTNKNSFDSQALAIGKSITNDENVNQDIFAVANSAKEKFLNKY